MRKILCLLFVLAVVGCDNTVTQNGNLDFLQEGELACKPFGGIYEFEIIKPFASGFMPKSESTEVRVVCVDKRKVGKYYYYPFKRSIE